MSRSAIGSVSCWDQLDSEVSCLIYWKLTPLKNVGSSIREKSLVTSRSELASTDIIQYGVGQLYSQLNHTTESENYIYIGTSSTCRLNVYQQRERGTGERQRRTDEQLPLFFHEVIGYKLWRSSYLPSLLETVFVTHTSIPCKHWEIQT